MIDSIGTHLNPNFGILSIPYTGFGYYENSAMYLRKVLAVNFKKLREATPTLANLPNITKSGGGSNGTLSRIQLAQTGVSVDVVEQLAASFQVEPWQLLHPNLEVMPGPRGRALLSGLPDWPFAMIDRARYDQLDDEQRGFVQSKLDDAITQATKARKVKASGQPPQPRRVAA